MGNVIWTPNNNDAVGGAVLHRANSLLASANIAAVAVASDAAEANSTADRIVATAHSARVGDIIRITSGTHSGVEVRALKIPDANTIIIEALSSAIGVADTFDILRPRHLIADASGNLNVSIANSAGSYAEDSPHTTGDEGIAILAVRNDSGAAMTSTDGDYGNLTVDGTGRLRVDATITEAATAADGGALPAVVKVAGGYDGANVQVLRTDVAGDLQVDLASSLPAGTNNIGDVDVLTEPATAADASAGLPAVVKVVGGYDGANVQALSTDVNGRANVNVVDSLPAGNNNIGDVDVASLPGSLRGYTEDAAHTTGDFGVMPLAVRNDAGAALAGTDGDYIPLSTDATGNLRVSVGTEAATAADGGALPAVQKVIAGYDGANTQVIKTDVAGELQVDVLTLPGSLTGYAEDSVHNSGDIGVMNLAVRRDANTSLVGADGDYAPLQVDSVGALKVSGTVTAVQGGKSVVTTVRNDYTSTSVTTGAWVQLVASLGAAVTEMEIFDSSGQTLEIGTGAAAAETRLILLMPGGNGRVPTTIAAGTRVSVRAVSATASVGELDINFYGV